MLGIRCPSLAHPPPGIKLGPLREQSRPQFVIEQATDDYDKWLIARRPKRRLPLPPGIQTGDRKTKQRISEMVAAEKARPTTDHTGCNANIKPFFAPVVSGLTATVGAGYCESGS